MKGNKTIRLLLINALNPRIEVENRYPGLGLAYIAASVRKKLPEVSFEFRIADRDIPRVCEEFRPDLVGISSVSQNFDIAKRYSDYFASKDIPVVLGGFHITALPGSLPSSANAACLGEGESSFVDIIKLYLADSLTPENLFQVPGVAFWKDGMVQCSAERPQISELDELPMPARDLLTIRRHAYMFTSRGCPFRCTFCASCRFWKTLRFFSAEYVVDEIEFLSEHYGVNMISLFDDLFVADKPRLERIARLLEKRGLAGKIKYTCSCRVNIVNEETVRLLSRIGVVSVGIGLESGDRETLRFLKGENVDLADNYSAIELLKKREIFVNASFIIGSPLETKEQIMRTYEFIRKSKLDLFDIYLLTPLPGTPIWEYAKARGLVRDDMPDWSRLSVNAYSEPDKAIILSEVLKKEDIIGLYKKFLYLRFFRNLSRVYRHPMRRDLPRMAINLIKEHINRFHLQ